LKVAVAVAVAVAAAAGLLVNIVLDQGSCGAVAMLVK